MEVELKLIFQREEIEALCIKEAEKFRPTVPGHFEAHSGGYSYSQKVSVDFVVDEEPVPVPVVPPSFPATANMDNVVLGGGVSQSASHEEPF